MPSKEVKIAGLFTLTLVVLLGLTVFFQAEPADLNSNDVVKEVAGVQIIDITARGGYSPRTVSAKANTPTEIRFLTNGTYDCSSSVVIPALDYEAVLEPSGVETVRLSAEQATGTLSGTCAMGMYGFTISFN